MFNIHCGHDFTTTFTISARMASRPGAFPCFIFLTTVWSYAIENGSNGILIGSSPKLSLALGNNSSAA